MSDTLFNLHVQYDKDAFPTANYSSLCVFQSLDILKKKGKKKPKTVKKFALVLQLHNTKNLNKLVFKLIMKQFLVFLLILLLFVL